MARDPDPPHHRHVAVMALALFDQLRDLHGLEERCRPLLEAAALLHDVGWCDGGKGHHKRAYDLILQGDLPLGEDLPLVAAVARYHRRGLPKRRHRALRDLDREDRRAVRWLAALLRVADGLDVEHRGQVTGLSCGLGDGTVEVIVRAAASPRAALEAAARKADLFREISGRNLVMQWKP